MPEQVRSVVRSFELLRLLAAARGPLALGDLAAGAGLPKSTTRRLLVTLESVRAVERGVEPGTYVSGAGLAAIGGAGPAQPGLHVLARPFLSDVVEFMGEDATLAVLDQDSVVFTAQLTGPHPIQVPDGTGTRFAPHTVSSGFALLSDASDAQLERYADVAGSREDFDVADLRLKIDEVRRLGYVWHIDRWVDGVSAVAAPIRGADGTVVAALGAFGPTYRFPGERDRAELGVHLARLGEQLSAHLSRR